jgi:hypothetical protein
METIILWMPAIFSFLTGTLIAASLFNIFQTIQTMYSVCQIRSNQSLLKKIRKQDALQFCGGILVTAILSFLLFYPTQFVAHYMQTILLLEILYGLFLFSVAERAFKCCDFIHKKTISH